MTQARTRPAALAARIATLAVAAGLLVSLPAPAATAAPVAPVARKVDPVAGGLTAAPADTLFPNQGNSGYDAQHYDIDFSVDVGISPLANVASTTTIDATATIDAVTTGAPLSSYAFDFQGTSTTLEASTLDVTAVSVNGVPASFTRIENTTVPNATTDVHKLVVTPAAPVEGAFTTVVQYAGQPVVHRDTDNSIEGWNNTVDGATFVNQPVGSMTLFPNNNTPRDKATYTFTVEAPTKLRSSNPTQTAEHPVAVASNGELTSKTPSADGSTTTWVWEQREQMASELSMVSVGRYDVYTSDITLASGRTIPEWTFIDPAISAQNRATTLSSRAQLKQMIDFMEARYGPYPGNSTGLVTDNTTGINYALETQDRPFFPNSAGRGTTIHEMMHAWWGNNVSPVDWNDIVISEGSARYSESQFPYESAGSSTTTTETAMYNLWNGNGATSGTFAVAPAAMTQASQLFGAQVYNKGAITLEALRTSIGDADFRTLMRTWQDTYGGTDGSVRRTQQFEDLAESITGRDLTAFFQTWWYTAGKPAWPVKFNLDTAVPQVQVNPGDSYPLTLSARNTGKVAMPGGQTTITVDAADLLDDASIGTLPAGVTQSGTTLTWTVPATALAATSTVTVRFTVNPGTTGSRLRATVRAATLGSTCLTCVPSATVGAAPVSPSPVPTITGLNAGGAPVVGQAVTADTAGWPVGTSFTYQWLIDGTPVPGATSATYVPTGDNVGFTAAVKVVGAVAGAQPTAATSAPTALGVRAPFPVVVPTISGTPAVGQPLTVSEGPWPAGTVYTYQWRANGTNIAASLGSAGPIFTPTAAQLGQTLDVVVSSTKYGYTGPTTTVATGTSAPTAAVAVGTQTLQPTPTIAPLPPRPETVVTASPGTWDTGSTQSYRWLLDGTPTGVTTTTFTPAVGDIGKVLVFEVTSTRTGFATVVKTSEPATVAPSAQTLTPTPVVTGTGRVAEPLTVDIGTWDAGTTQTIQWTLDGEPIDGATGDTYTPTPAQAGGVVRVVVTSTRENYETVTRTSDPVTVLDGLQTSTPTPTITGTPKVAVELTGVPGTWDDGVTLTYRWLADGTAVAGATGTTFTPAPAQLGAVVTFEVTGTRAGYATVVRTSDPTAAVAAGDQVLTPTPTITGTAKVGVQLTGVPGTWDDGATLTYQWRADGVAIGGATATTFTPTAAQVGAVITFAVTGAKPGYTSVTRVSDPTAAVVVGDQASTPTPTITGTAKVAVQLTGVPGTWDDGVTLTYRWLADGVAVAGATGTTFTPGPNQVGRRLTFEVTGTRPGYAPVTRTSAQTAAVVVGDQVLSPTPTVTGTPKVGVQLTGNPGTWDAGTSLAYQWVADGTPVPGATSLTYTPTAAQVGAVLRFVVTSTRTGYATATRYSDATAPVAAGDLAPTSVPTISGTPKVGVELTAVPGEWDAAASLTYVWRAGTQQVGTGPTYTPRAGQVGTTITVSVTGTRPGYAPVTETSEPTAAVALGDQVRRPVPGVSGVRQVGSTLTVVPGTWDDGTTLTYQWLREGAPIAGATGATYALPASDQGRQVRVVVTSRKPGYADAIGVSAVGPVVAPGVLTRQPKPTVSGVAKVGRTLTAVPGTHDAGVTLRYQWFAGSEAVAGATGRTLQVTAAHLTRKIKVRVTATKPGYVAVTKNSERTARVTR